MVGFQLHKIWMRRALYCATLMVSATSVMAQSADITGSSLRISGFGTIGLTHADGPDGWGYRRNISQPGNDGGFRADVDSRLGVQFNYAPTPQFELVGQLVAKRRSSYAPLSDSIEWAFAAYRPLPDLAIRVGRLNIDSFLLADYRNVGFAYRYVRPPVEFYGSLPRSLDGIDINKDLQFDDSSWRFKAFTGFSNSGDLAVDSRTEIGPVVGLTASRESAGLTLRAGFARVALTENPTILQPLIDGLGAMTAIPIPSIVAEAQAFQTRLDSENKHTLYLGLGMNYEFQDWLLTIEFTRNSGHPSAHLKAGYIGVGKQIGALTLFGGVSQISTPNLPVATPDWATTLTPILGSSAALQSQILAYSAAGAINSSGANQKNFSLGGRWDFRSNMALKVQWEHINIEAYGGRLWSNSTFESGNADVTSLLLDFVF